MKKYTQKQIKELKQNPYTLQINEKRIFFTVEFKKVFCVNVNIKFTKNVSLNFTSFGCYDFHPLS